MFQTQIQTGPQYVKIKNGVVVKYPYNIDELRAENPNISFPEIISSSVLEGFGVFKVEAKSKPQVSYDKNLIEGTPELDQVTNKWVQTWDTIDATSEEIALRIELLKYNVNSERDRKISEPKLINLGNGRTFTVDMANGGRENIGDLVTLAIVQKSSGASGTTISFRDASNIDQTLTNDEMIEVGVQVAIQVQQIHLKARAIKEMTPIPEDYYDNKYW